MAALSSKKKKTNRPSAKKPVKSVRKKVKSSKPPQNKKKQVKKIVKKTVQIEKIKQLPSHPTNGEQEGVRKLLIEMRAKLLSEFAETRIPETLAATSDIGDLVDQAGDERDRELSLLLTGREKEKVLAINEALEKVNEGTYGICEECGERIGPGRLKVMPLAKFCVACQSKLEREMTLQKKAEEELKYRSLGYNVAGEEEEG
jgi:DnaK suppressor protein